MDLERLGIRVNGTGEIYTPGNSQTGTPTNINQLPPTAIKSKNTIEDITIESMRKLTLKLEGINVPLIYDQTNPRTKQMLDELGVNYISLTKAIGKYVDIVIFPWGSMPQDNRFKFYSGRSD